MNEASLRQRIVALIVAALLSLAAAFAASAVAAEDAAADNAEAGNLGSAAAISQDLTIEQTQVNAGFGGVAA